LKDISQEQINVFYIYICMCDEKFKQDD